MNKIKIQLAVLLLVLISVFMLKNSVVQAASVGDADLGGDALGPYIRVGLHNYSKKDLKNNTLKISANKAYHARDKKGNVLVNFPANSQVNLRYDSDKSFRLYDPETDEIIKTVDREVTFESSVEEEKNIIFDFNKPGSSFDHYRGKLRIKYYDSEEADGDSIWLINVLPLEHYTWGMGEITGTGPINYNRLMAATYRTYGYWKIKYSTKYAPMGFHVDATSGSQIYYGYDWEKSHPNIKLAATQTAGKIVMYKDEIALTPYSSWDDGYTRRFENGHWSRKCVTKSKDNKSKVYPWLSSVKDPYGKEPKKSTCTLAKSGNHMVGMSAHGALKLADKYRWNWDKILKHYYSGIRIVKVY